MDISTFASNGPDAPVGFDHDAGVKVCDFPFFAAESIGARSDDPLELAGDLWRSREGADVALYVGRREARYEDGAL